MSNRVLICSACAVSIHHWVKPCSPVENWENYTMGYSEKKNASR